MEVLFSLLFVFSPFRFHPLLNIRCPGFIFLRPGFSGGGKGSGTASSGSDFPYSGRELSVPRQVEV
jgi:hypothetical protein